MKLSTYAHVIPGAPSDTAATIANVIHATDERPLRLPVRALVPTVAIGPLTTCAVSSV